MPELITPHARLMRSYLEAMREFEAEGRGVMGDNTMLGSDIRNNKATWSTPDGFAAYVDWLVGQALEDSPRPTGYVPSTTLWWVEGDDYLGRLAIRHRLTPSLLEAGGHIGYDIRPTARRRGHATAMLREGLAAAYDLGVNPALLTCEVTNVASRRVIEINGGQLEDQRGGKFRFWIPTR